MFLRHTYTWPYADLYPIDVHLDSCTDHTRSDWSHYSFCLLGTSSIIYTNPITSLHGQKYLATQDNYWIQVLQTEHFAAGVQSQARWFVLKSSVISSVELWWDATRRVGKVWWRRDKGTYGAVSQGFGLGPLSPVGSILMLCSKSLGKTLFCFNITVPQSTKQGP